MPNGLQPAILIGTEKALADGACRTPVGLEIPEAKDAYAVWTATSEPRGQATVCSAGHDERGALFAVGRLLRVLEMERDILK